MTTLWQSVRGWNKAKYLETGKIPPLEGRGWLLLVGVAVFAVWNTHQLLDVLWWGPQAWHANDWAILGTVDPADPYATWWYKWSIPAAWIWGYLITPMGPILWTVLHFAALALLPRVVAFTALVTFPFWFDLANGNIIVFVTVAAWHALAGNRWGVIAFVALAVLVPRPIMLPVLLWLLWTRTDARWAFLAVGAFVGVVTILSGSVGAWASHLFAAASSEMTATYNYSPSRWIGWWWVVIAVPLAVIATVKGRFGIASLLATPYVIYYYPVMLLLELRLHRLVFKNPAHMELVTSRPGHRDCRGDELGARAIRGDDEPAGGVGVEEHRPGEVGRARVKQVCG